MHDDGRPVPSDDDLLEAVGAVFDEDEGLPVGAVDFAAGVFTWRDVDAELAEFLHDPADAGLVAVRDGAAAQMLAFRSGDVILELEYVDGEVFAAVEPPGRYRVVVRGGSDGPAGPPLASATTGDDGIVRLAGLGEAMVRFEVASEDGAVVLITPWVSP